MSCCLGGCLRLILFALWRAKLRVAVDVEEGLDIAYEHIGRPPRASLLIVPRALHTLPVVTAGLATA